MSAVLQEKITAVLLDRDGDELRVETSEEGRLYVTSSQETCTATVGPFTRAELTMLVDMAGGAR